ncbi:hypothetical protein MTO96_051965 [Rhipicephalus appendiculatus]
MVAKGKFQGSAMVPDTWCHSATSVLLVMGRDKTVETLILCMSTDRGSIKTELRKIRNAPSATVQDDFPGVRQGDADNSETLEPSPGPSSFPGNKSSDEDDVDGTYAVRGAPLPDWLNVDGEVLEEPLHDPDLSFLEDV